MIIQKKLFDLEKLIFLREAITKGDFYVDNNMIFGKALVNAQFDGSLSAEELGLMESFSALAFYMYGGIYGIFPAIRQNRLLWTIMTPMERSLKQRTHPARFFKYKNTVVSLHLISHTNIARPHPIVQPDDGMGAFSR